MRSSARTGIRPVLLSILLISGCTGQYPAWITWESDACVVNATEFQLRDRTVYCNEKAVFDEDWKCAKMLACDLDEDKQQDLLFLIWNHTDYGDHHPFWEENDTTSLSQHLYIYHVQEGMLVPMWMSSRLDIAIQDIETEGNRLYVKEADGEVSLWEWSGYSIRRIDPQ